MAKENHDRPGWMIRDMKRRGISDERQMPDWVAPEFQAAWRTLQQQRLKQQRRRK